MERLIVSGIICFLCIGYVLSQLNSDPVVIAVNVTHLNTKLGDRVVMNCYGNTAKITSYMANTVSWYQDKEPLDPNQAGSKHRVTNGFFVIDSPFIDTTKYTMAPVQDTQDQTYSFPLVINGVTDEDYGDWLCRLNEGGSTQFSQEKKVKLEILEDITEIEIRVEGDSGASSKVPYSEDMDATPVKAGSAIQVSCRTKGSNPKPTMKLIYGNTELAPIPEGRPEPVANKRTPTITAGFAVEQRITGKNKEMQKLVCRAEIEGFPPHDAGLKLKVVAYTVEFRCSNTTAIVGNKQRALTCYLWFEEDGGLTCDHIFWRIDKSGTKFNPTTSKPERKNVKDFGITEAGCEMENGKVKTRLTFFDLYEIHFAEDTTFTIGANIDGSEPQTHEVSFIEGEMPSTSSVISPVSMMFCLVLATLSRKVSKC